MSVLTKSIEEKLNILLVSPIPPPAGGMASWSKLYLDSDFADRNNISVINTSKISVDKGYLTNKINLIDELRRTASIYSGIRNSLIKEKFNVIHFNVSCSKLGMIRDIIYALIMKNQNARLFIHFHCDTSYSIRSGIAKYPFKILCRLADTIICLNKSSQSHIYRIAGKPSILIPNFINDTTTNNSSERVISEHIGTVIYAGHVIKAKGCDDIISAAWKLPQINFKLIGCLSDEIERMSCPDNVNFLGEVSKERVYQEMKTADLLVFPSHTEGFPVAVLEAMISGLPIIATRVGAIPDMLENKGGIFVEVGDVSGIIEAIEKMQDKKIRSEMSKWNKNKVLNFYTVDIVMKQLSRIYKDNRHTEKEIVK